MLIAFAHAWEGQHVKYFLETVKKYELWQITDETTPELPGVNVFRHPREKDEGFVLWRARAYAEFGQVGAYLDTDVLVRHDIRPIMELDFDIALTKTKAVVKDPLGTNLTEYMPYNGGVMFIKNPNFLHDVARKIETLDDSNQKWYGDQFALPEVAKRYTMVELPNAIYNYKPKRPDIESGTLPDSVWLAHFKGDLKQHMGKFR